MKRYGIVLLIVVLIGVFIRLGVWQLSRAAQRQALLDSHAQARQLTALDQLPRLEGWETQRYRRIELATGRYQTERTLLLDNQVYNGRAGYHIITPYRQDGEDCMVLVDRGWIEANADRRQLPIPTEPTEQTPLAGMLDRLTVPGLKLAGGAEPTSSKPAVVQWLDSAVLAERWGVCVWPYQIRLAADAAYGYQRDWQIESIDPNKNRAYAFQWFAMALALSIYSLWWLWRSQRTPPT